jgi:hypothetical protein
MTENFQAITKFIVEIEKLKNIQRKIKPVGLSNCFVGFDTTALLRAKP